MKYSEFIESKKHSQNYEGFVPLFYPDIAFDFQKHIIKESLRRGRTAIYLDTGLGKTLIQLSIAHNISLKTKGKILIITPLAVAHQFMKEADKIGVDSVSYSRDGKIKTNITLCNYEMLSKFNSEDFTAVLLDESSILKNFKGTIKSQITKFLRNTKYRFLSTATPSPNDHIELGTSSEALGYMGYMDMISKFFKNNQNTADSNLKNVGSKFYLKPHATKDFYSWVNTWSINVKKPSDIGFSDDRYKLPDLNINRHVVKNDSLITVDNQISFLTPIAKSLAEVKHEVRQTLKERCNKAYNLAKDKTSVYWVNLNDESNYLAKIDSEAVEILGSMSVEQKENILKDFAEGKIKRIITKAKMTGVGLNWQHCNHSVFFPTYSYEQYYQAIRRFWRFGQLKDVTIDVIISDGQKRVLQAIEEKTQKAIELDKELKQNANRQYNQEIKPEIENIIKPSFV